MRLSLPGSSQLDVSALKILKDNSNLLRKILVIVCSLTAVREMFVLEYTVLFALDGTFLSGLNSSCIHFCRAEILKKHFKNFYTYSGIETEQKYKSSNRMSYQCRESAHM